MLVTVWERSAQRLRPQTSDSQLRALLVVERYPSINVMGLAEELGSVPSVTSRLCDRLEAAGLLVRTPADDDRRSVTLGLSRDGRRLLRRLREQRQADLADVVRAMPVGSRRSLLAGLTAFQRAAVELGLPDDGPGR